MCIIFFKFDELLVCEFIVVDYLLMEFDFEVMNYLKVGSFNLMVMLGIVLVVGGVMCWVDMF